MGLLKEDHSEIKLVPDESRSAWFRHSENDYHACSGKSKDYNTLNLRPKVRVEFLRPCQSEGTYFIDDKWYCWRHTGQASR